MFPALWFRALIRTQTERTCKQTERLQADLRASSKAGRLVWLVALSAAAITTTFASQLAAAASKQLELPYTSIDHPQFVSASQAVFLHPNDLLIGVTGGKTAKAYPAAILAQHGVVQDQMSGGPIAVTW